MNLDQIIEFTTNHSMLVAALAAVLVMLAFDIIRHTLSGVADVEPGQATRLLNAEHAVMVDFRSTQEFRSGHIANAVHIENVEGAGEKLGKYRDKPLIVYCNSGNRSIGICGKLRKQGFDRVYNLKGGLQAWQKAELPVAKN
jgi:rhodanese-related sulfurtransferase